MLKNLWAKRQELTAKFNQVNAADITDSKLKSKFDKLKGKQTGFTLLELLVVVAILAAIAGTASLALQDTDARAAAAAHVAMMDELNKGIRTYRVLNKNSLPTGFDSLVQVNDVALASPALLEVAAIEDVVLDEVTHEQFGRLAEVGLTSFNYVSVDQDPDGDGNCSTGAIAGLIGSRQNAVVAGNIFLSANANGCGVRVVYNETATANEVLSQAFGAVQASTPLDLTATNLPIATWNGGLERITGQAEAGAFNADGNTVLMATGIGPGSSLFDAKELGGMTSVPVYRHVSEVEYNRFIALWDIGTYDSAGEIVANDQPSLAGIVDGAGDTKEEELGEWDGTRNTI